MALAWDAKTGSAAPGPEEKAHRPEENACFLFLFFHLKSAGASNCGAGGGVGLTCRHEGQPDRWRGRKAALCKWKIRALTRLHCTGLLLQQLLPPVQPSPGAPWHQEIPTTSPDRAAATTAPPPPFYDVGS
ncbi:hypothetical protein AXG93_4316s1100 [Marchantia polymorpha subsp. ruderalis]|uniref:Uncharacterized protein n=1 Tax=Marchantia polymorpha subsp. ruderalis TaxID=1480154 RepID=A0A176VRT6_MARPO|nr:hypothetical protein AXG93_4316s1100 [Marchantia polymorpha subsp. ruderalis]